jgi:hypothetical protein
MTYQEGTVSISHTAKGLYPKADLARHIGEPHERDGLTSRIVTPLVDLREWRRDELERAHRELHGETP